MVTSIIQIMENSESSVPEQSQISGSARGVSAWSPGFEGIRRQERSGRMLNQAPSRAA